MAVMCPSCKGPRSDDPNMYHRCIKAPAQMSFDFVAQDEIKRLREVVQEQREELMLLKEKQFQVRVLLTSAARALNGD